MKKLNKMFKMHFCLKQDFTFFKTDSINGFIIVFIKKMKKNIVIFQKTLFGHFYFLTQFESNCVIFIFYFQKTLIKIPTKWRIKSKFFKNNFLTQIDSNCVKIIFSKIYKCIEVEHSFLE